MQKTRQDKAPIDNTIVYLENKSLFIDDNQEIICESIAHQMQLCYQLFINYPEIFRGIISIRSDISDINIARAVLGHLYSSGNHPQIKLSHQRAIFYYSTILESRDLEDDLKTSILLSLGQIHNEYYCDYDLAVCCFSEIFGHVQNSPSGNVADYAFACLHLCYNFHLGLGVPVSQERAQDLYRRAIEAYQEIHSTINYNKSKSAYWLELSEISNYYNKSLCTMTQDKTLPDVTSPKKELYIPELSFIKALSSKLNTPLEAVKSPPRRIDGSRVGVS